MAYTISTGSLFGQPFTTYSGLMSGINTAALVSARMAAASQNQSILRAGAVVHATQAGLYAGLAKRLGALDATSRTLTDAGVFAPSTGVSQDASKVSAVVSTVGQTGTYRVSVSQLAAAQINTSDTLSSSTASVLAPAPAPTFFNPNPKAPTSGSLTVQVGNGASQSFAVNTATTLQSLAADINRAHIGVAAAVVSDANGARLTVTGNQTGSDNAVRLTETNLRLNLAKNLTQKAQNAQGSVNGAAFDISQNASQTLVDGVTLNFAALTSSPVTVTVSKSGTSVSHAVEAFVMNYNTVLEQLRTASAVAGDGSGADLSDDAAVRNATNTLMRLVTSSPKSATGGYRTLADVGVRLTHDGTLFINPAQLQAAIATDASSVSNLLATTTAGVGVAKTVQKMAADYGGSYGTLMRMSRDEAAIGAARLEAADDMQYSLDMQQATMSRAYVRLATQLSALNMQNLVVKGFAAAAEGSLQQEANNPDGVLEAIQAAAQEQTTQAAQLADPNPSASSRSNMAESAGAAPTLAGQSSGQA